jgi:hypothetical protein
VKRSKGKKTLANDQQQQQKKNTMASAAFSLHATATSSQRALVHHSRSRHAASTPSTRRHSQRRAAVAVVRAANAAGDDAAAAADDDAAAETTSAPSPAKVPLVDYITTPAKAGPHKPTHCLEPPGFQPVMACKGLLISFHQPLSSTYDILVSTLCFQMGQLVPRYASEAAKAKALPAPILGGALHVEFI